MTELPLPTAPVPASAPAPAPFPAPAVTAPAPRPTANRGNSVWGWALIVLGALFLANNLLPSFGDWIAPAIFAGVGIAFLAWYGARPEHPWPILAGGGLLSLAAVTAWNLLTSDGSGTVLFVGLAATFFAFAAAPPAPSQRRWGYWTAGLCLVLAVLATGFSWAWPLVLIGLGAWLLLRRAVGSRA
ncbi:MAG TPA: hypothetical protein VND98_03055 [Solirubrobacterales bacterium]|nr:hypothetical protein [Solirubrobacterales bacterium]